MYGKSCSSSTKWGSPAMLVGEEITRPFNWISLAIWVSFVVVVAGAAAFIWAINSGLIVLA